MGAWAVSAWLLSLVIDGFLLFASIFRLILIEDIRHDYINPIEYAQRVNFLWWPEFAGYSVAFGLALLFGPWWVVFLQLPVAAYLLFIMLKQRIHKVDPTRVLQGDTIKQQQRSTVVRLIFNLVWFLLYLYLVISEAIMSLKDRAPVATF